MAEAANSVSPTRATNAVSVKLITVFARLLSMMGQEIRQTSAYPVFTWRELLLMDKLKTKNLE